MTFGLPTDESMQRPRGIQLIDNTDVKVFLLEFQPFLFHFYFYFLASCVLKA